MRITPEIITELKANEIFVFGSNTAGKHGAGAARLAHKKFGAVYGVGIGLCGNSYAIPTKDDYIRTLPLHYIQNYVNDFIQFARETPSLNFLVTAIGTGLAGYSVKDIAPMFTDVLELENVYLPQSFIDFLMV